MTTYVYLQQTTWSAIMRWIRGWGEYQGFLSCANRPPQAARPAAQRVSFCLRMIIKAIYISTQRSNEVRVNWVRRYFLINQNEGIILNITIGQKR